MVRLILVFLMAVPVAAEAAGHTEKERQETQLTLDRQCEHARDKALYPMRLKIFKECRSDGKSEEYCNAEAGAYYGDRINGASLFYDLPECEKAFEYRKTHRTRG